MLTVEQLADIFNKMVENGEGEKIVVVRDGDGEFYFANGVSVGCGVKDGNRVDFRKPSKDDCIPAVAILSAGFRDYRRKE